jgi:adenosylcobinamide kinase/adenosylcobinamide-phosphate guanylyltransferase
VGAGIVPENRLARLFRDLAGFTNQKVAKVADKVIFMAAGIPVAIKEG